MQVLLLRDVEKLGTEGDVVNVADGYARNYLVPRKIAVAANPNTVALQNKIRAARARRIEEERLSAQQTAERIANLSCTIRAKVGEEDKLFGSVSSADIAKLLADEGIEVDRKHILLESPIKALGVYSVDIKLHPEVTVPLRLWVVQE